MSDDAAEPDESPSGCPSSGAGLLPPELRAWMLLLAATGGVEQRLRSVVKEQLGVSHDEFLILCLLAEEKGESTEGGVRMTRIADLLGRPKTRLTYQVALLQRAGLVTRASACGDKRGVEVALTDKARTLLRQASAALATTVTDAIAQFVGAAQQEALHSLIPAPEEARN